MVDKCNELKIFIKTFVQALSSDNTVDFDSSLKGTFGQLIAIFPQIYFSSKFLFQILPSLFDFTLF